MEIAQLKSSRCYLKKISLALVCYVPIGRHVSVTREMQLATSAWQF